MYSKCKLLSVFPACRPCISYGTIDIFTRIVCEAECEPRASMPFASSHRLWSFGVLTTGALGVVYGNIGTSPLYAFNQIFSPASSFALSEQHAFQAISLIFWSLTLLISFEYLLLVLRADHKGEGGVFALLALLGGPAAKRFRLITGLLMFSAGFLYADGIITPAISVLSAVEGLGVATSTFIPYVMPLSLLILTVLFSVQHLGTGKVGTMFGPIIILWFISIGALGLHQILQHPEILLAVHPGYAVQFFQETSWPVILTVLGAVMLAVTGGEAIYADLGHFGRAPMRLAWFLLALPCLLLNYFGQGAYVLSGQPIVNGNIFFSLVPRIALYPMVILATLAAIIASQAIISAIFSATHQATKLRLLPRFKTIHTNASQPGQIYQPTLNWLLYGGCILLVLMFHYSSALATAYGLTVSGLMCITALAMCSVSRDVWRWNILSATIVFGFFAAVYLLFFAANGVHFANGGYLPLLISVLLFSTMTKWAAMRDRIQQAVDFSIVKSLAWVRALRQDPAVPDLPRAIAFITSRPLHALSDRIPSTFFFFFQQYGALPRHLLFIHPEQSETVSVIPPEERYRVLPIGNRILAVTAWQGFMESFDARQVLTDLHGRGHITIPAEQWIIEQRENVIVVQGKASKWFLLRLALFGFLNSVASLEQAFFKLGGDAATSTQAVPLEMRRSQLFLSELSLTLKETTASGDEMFGRSQ